MNTFTGFTKAGILIHRQHAGVTNEAYVDQLAGDWSERGIVLDTSFRSGSQRGANVEVALYGSNIEVTVAGDFTIGSKLLNGVAVTEGVYNAVADKPCATGFTIVRLTNGTISAVVPPLAKKAPVNKNEEAK